MKNTLDSLTGVLNHHSNTHARPPPFQRIVFMVLSFDVFPSYPISFHLQFSDSFLFK